MKPSDDIYTVGQPVGDRSREIIHLPPNIIEGIPLADIPDMNYDRDMKQRPLCWLPLVVVQTLKAGHSHAGMTSHRGVAEQFASAALTSLFLCGKNLRKEWNKPVDEIIMSGELDKLMQQKTMILSRSSHAHIALYCTAFNELNATTDIEIQGAPPKAVRGFESFAQKVIEKAPKWGVPGQVNDLGRLYRLKVCMVAPVITTKLTTMLKLQNDSRDQIIAYEYAPFTSMEKGAFERVLNVSSSIGFKEAYPILGSLPTHQWMQPVTVGYHNRLHEDEWRPGLLFDCGLRTSASYGKLAMISKRLKTALMEIPSVCDIMPDAINEDGDHVSSELFYGDRIAAPDGENRMSFPSRVAAERFARIVSAADIEDDSSGITPPSYTEDDEGSTEHGVMFIETWKDTRGILLVDLSGLKPVFYHEFIRCTTCNGEVEVRAPQTHIPPETDCPHCDGEGSVSWGDKTKGS